MKIKCGILGLPNVGKSTLFNILTKTAHAVTANYPFCTIHPNISTVTVPDERLKIIAKINNSNSIVGAQIEFVDIAGLVKGASKGIGLGNKFLSHIRNVDAICHVVRCFTDDNISHVYKDIDPSLDIEIVETELILADIENLEKQKASLIKKECNQYSLRKKVLIDTLLITLNKGKLGIHCINDKNYNAVQELNLLTTKPYMYICNMRTDEINCGNYMSKKVAIKAKQYSTYCVNICAKIEKNLSSDKKMESYLNYLIATSYKVLGLQTYFTSGRKETRAWTYQKGATAEEAASIIHTDFKKGFICAEVIKYSDYIKYNGIQGAKQHGLQKQEGKNYIVNDGDIINFRFNVSKK